MALTVYQSFYDFQLPYTSCVPTYDPGSKTTTFTVTTANAHGLTANASVVTMYAEFPSIQASGVAASYNVSTQVSTVVITTASPHGLSASDYVDIRDAQTPGLNGTYGVSNVFSKSFTLTIPGNLGAPILGSSVDIRQTAL